MSVNAVDQSTGNTTPLAGNTNNLVGNLSALTTSVKSDAVGAINEVNQTKQNATDNNLQTTNKTIVGGINELKSGLTNKLNSSVYAQFGCKNLNAYPYYESSKTDLGIAFTVNDDGSVTASGTNDGTSDSYFDMHTSSTSELNSLTLPNGNYIINGTPANDNLYSFVVRVRKGGEFVTLGQDRGSGAEFSVNGDDNYSDKADVIVRIIVKKKVVLSEPVTFYPMIRAAGVADGTWEPYVKSNKQLTDGLASVESGLTNAQSAINSKVVANIESAADTDYAYLERIPGRNYLICVNTQGSNGVNGYAPLVGVLRMGYQGQNFNYTPILTSDTYHVDITWDSTESKYKIQEIKTSTSEAGINLVGFAVGINPWT